MNPYFVAPNGHQQGPYSLKNLEELMRSGQLKGSDLCWREGMMDWQSISTAIPSLLTHQSNDPNSFGVNPYLPPRSSVARAGYGGIGRAAYFGFSVLMAFAGFVTGLAVESNIDETRVPASILGVMGIGLVLNLTLLSLRLKNTGNNRWLLLLFLVPAINVLFAFALGIYVLIAPEGYADTRKLDAPGKVMAWIVGLFFGGLLLLMLFAMVSPLIFR